jgi:hypothetical protein
MLRPASFPFVAMLGAIFFISIAAGENHPAFAQSAKRKVVPPKEKVPAWWSTLPRSETETFFRGKGESKDQQLAIDKAAMEARTGLANEIRRQWGELIASANGEGVTPPPSAKTDQIPVHDSKIAKQSASKKGKMWTAYVLVSYPRTEIDRSLLELARADEAWYRQASNTPGVKRLLQRVH